MKNNTGCYCYKAINQSTEVQSGVYVIDYNNFKINDVILPGKLFLILNYAHFYSMNSRTFSTRILRKTHMNRVV